MKRLPIFVLLLVVSLLVVGRAFVFVAKQQEERRLTPAEILGCEKPAREFVNLMDQRLLDCPNVTAGVLRAREEYLAEDGYNFISYDEGFEGIIVIADGEVTIYMTSKQYDDSSQYGGGIVY